MESDKIEALQYRVLSNYEVNYPHPLILAKGVAVEVVRKDSGWPGWVWIRSGDQTGWIPELYLAMKSGPESYTLKAFNGCELSANKGTLLEAIESVSGWIYASDPCGNKGWFPLFNLKPVQQT